MVDAPLRRAIAGAARLLYGGHKTGVVDKSLPQEYCVWREPGVYWKTRIRKQARGQALSGIGDS